jgi:prepilin-type N-terminal cleavage/methylation domain-containing protein
MLNINIPKNYHKISGLTLIEVMVTITVIVILTAASMANMGRLRRPKTLVDEATDLIVNILNQANSESITTNTAIEVCQLDRGTDGRGTCNTSATQWENINGNTFSQRVRVNVDPGQIIAYDNGLVTLNNINSAAFTITVQATEQDTICGDRPLNTISLWSNGVLEIAKSCNT